MYKKYFFKFVFNFLKILFLAFFYFLQIFLFWLFESDFYDFEEKLRTAYFPLIVFDLLLIDNFFPGFYKKLFNKYKKIKLFFTKKDNKRKRKK
jgi:hypothetical protein